MATSSKRVRKPFFSEKEATKLLELVDKNIEQINQTAVSRRMAQFENWCFDRASGLSKELTLGCKATFVFDFRCRAVMRLLMYYNPTSTTTTRKPFDLLNLFTSLIYQYHN
ncbi:hypothetical protein PoB_005964300 [Plakobranchus ocellatus]|uniref:Uncharacterized protein n=1 Tax=Plakobranchus ocellatus TaxID=259542 RepID=A0AAV4CMH2_9GAST|nr:hypothetical protein PoB_005964300 [Plakobranchus ocellatus]